MALPGFSLPHAFTPPFSGPNIITPIHGEYKNLSDLIGKYTDWDTKIMTAVALAESGGNPKARHRNTNGTTDFGLLQVNSVHGFDSNCLLDPECNIDKAHDVWKQQGYGAWSTYNNKAYLLHMGQDKKVRVGTGTQADTAVDAVTAIPDAAKAGINGVGDFLHWVTDPSTWARIGKGALGTTLIVVGVGGIVLIVANKAGSSPTVQGAVMGATKVIK
jgi:hypothetical protein